MDAPIQLRLRRAWTNDPARPVAHTVTIAAGRVTALDADPPPHAEVIDLDGFALPGFIDAHIHFVRGGLALEQLDLAAVHSREAFEAAVARAHATLPDDAWLIGRGWSQDNWPDHALPDRTWLAAAGERPAVCYRMDEHAALVNAAVLARCDLDTPLKGGRVVRDARTGEPTGLMIEAAAWDRINPLVPRPAPARLGTALEAAEAYALDRGITTVGSMEYRRDVEEAYAPRRDHLRIRHRITLLDRAWPLDPSVLAFASSFAADDTLAIIGAKTFLDGTLGLRTAAMLAPYADDPTNRGALLELTADGALIAWARLVAAAGLSPSMHAIGDAAARLALEVVEDLDARGFGGGSSTPRIEHAQQIDPADVRRFAGVVASMQPLHRADDGRFARERLGADRIRGSFAFRQLLTAGARLAFGSDWPIVAADPLLGIRAAVTGLTHDGTTFRPKENLTPTEAIAAYTTGAAHALRLPGGGTLTPGTRGDVVVLDRDPFTCDWEGAPPAVVMTIAGGRCYRPGG